MVTFERTHLSPRIIAAIFIGVFAILSCSMISDVARFGLSRYLTNLAGELSRAYPVFGSHDQPRPKDVIGIELGRTYARAAYFKDDQVHIIGDKEGRTSIPTCVAFLDKSLPLVGFAAQERAAFDPRNTICDVNALLAANFSDPSIQNTINTLPYSVLELGGKLMIRTQLDEGENYHITPDSVIAAIFGELKAMAEAQLNRRITYALVAVPSHFTEAQRALVKETAASTGLIIERILTDTIAASIGYGDMELSEHPCRPNSYHAIIYQLEDHGSKLALQSWDGEQISYVTDESLSGLAIEQSPGNDTSFQSKACDLMAQLLQEANIPKHQINETMFTGNSTRIAKIQPAVESYLGKSARSFHLPSNKSVKPEEAIVRGVSMAAARWEDRFEGECMSYLDVLSRSIGIEILGGLYSKIINTGSVIPIRRKETFSSVMNNQENVLINVYEGDRLLARKNKLLGALQLEDLPLRPSGELEIEVVLEVDTCYGLTIKVSVKGSEKEEIWYVELDSWNGEMVGSVEDTDRFKAEDELALQKSYLEEEDNRTDDECGVQKKLRAERVDRVESGVKQAWWSWFSGGEKHEVWREEDSW